MLIPISISPASTSSLPPQIAKLGNGELVLIELQGSLAVECTDNSERDGQLVGKFRFEEGSSKPTLAIAHHLLEGKIVSLPKALAVIQKAGAAGAPPNSDYADDGMDETVQGDSVSGEGSSRWDMVAIVKKKIVFAKRPMPIVGSAAASLGTVGKK